MKTSLSLALCAALLASAAASSAEMTAAEVADRNVAARGGLQAWRAVSTLTLSGEMDAGGKQEVKLPFVLQMKRPHKSRLELRFQDQTALQTWDGAKGWKLRPYLNRNDVDAFTAAEAKQAAASDELDGPLVDYARKGTKIELLGTEAVAGKNAYKLRLTKAGGEQRNLWIDAQSFLELQIDGEPRKLDGRPHKVTVLYGDFKSVNGLMVPHSLETVVQGVKQTRKMTIKSVAVNKPLDDTLFGKPQAGAAHASNTF
jgi:outer membrane lipoprotein-sorting protein